MSDEAGDHKCDRRTILRTAGSIAATTAIGGVASADDGRRSGRIAVHDGVSGTGSGDECGVVTTTYTGEVDGGLDDASYEHDVRTANPCGTTLRLDGESSDAQLFDLELYVTLDGREPTTDDYDRRTWKVSDDHELEIDEIDVDASTTLGILVDCYTGEGSFELTVEESTEDGGGDDGVNTGPNASVLPLDGPVRPGETVTFHGYKSSDPDGTIVEYEWDFGDGTTKKGTTLTHVYEETGEFTAELTVTDDQGATDTASTSVVVENDDDGGYGDGECGAVTTTYTGEVDGGLDGETYEHDARTPNPCGATLRVDGESSDAQLFDLELYVTLDGREPTTDDYDLRTWKVSDDHELEIEAGNLDASTTLGILVDCYTGEGSFELTVEESTEDRGGDGDEGSPTAVIDVSESPVEAGVTVTFDGGTSTDEDGWIRDYEWEFGDGATDWGAYTTHSYTAAGEYEVTLTVTDDEGNSDTTSETVTVSGGNGDGGGGGGDSGCDAVSTTDTDEGSLEYVGDQETYTYTAALGDPCRVTVVLDGPGDANFDLYLTEDGRVPSIYDYDERSATSDSHQRIDVDDVTSGQEFGVLVDCWSGAGEYTLEIEESGR